MAQCNMSGISCSEIPVASMGVPSVAQPLDVLKMKSAFAINSLKRFKPVFDEVCIALERYESEAVVVREARDVAADVWSVIKDMPES